MSRPFGVFTPWRASVGHPMPSLFDVYRWTAHPKPRPSSPGTKWLVCTLPCVSSPFSVLKIAFNRGICHSEPQQRTDVNIRRLDILRESERHEIRGTLARCRRRSFILSSFSFFFFFFFFPNLPSFTFRTKPDREERESTFVCLLGLCVGWYVRCVGC